MLILYSGVPKTSLHISHIFVLPMRIFIVQSEILQVRRLQKNSGFPMQAILLISFSQIPYAAHHGADAPKALFLERVLDILPRQSAETVISLYRHKLIATIPTENLDREIDWTIEHARTNSPAMRAYLADLLRTKGDGTGFELEYRGALRIAQEEDIHIEQ